MQLNVGFIDDELTTVTIILNILYITTNAQGRVVVDPKRLVVSQAGGRARVVNLYLLLLPGGFGREPGGLRLV